MFDNRVFNINGLSKEMLLKTLELAFSQEGASTKANCYKIDPDRGMILYWYEQPGTIPFPTNMKPEEILDIVWAWLKSEPEVSTTYDADWDYDADHDGHNGRGWRVYCEGWGKVQDNSAAICAIKPVYLWYGK